MDFQCEDCDDQEYKGYACDPVINGRATLLLIITAQEYESLYSECSVCQISTPPNQCSFLDLAHCIV